MTPYDIIGDIHGHAARLEELLLKLGYQNSKGYYQHPERKTVFVGDLIDRGPENFRTLEIVKAMTDNQQAVAVMGNHEFNAICYHTKDENGEYLRPHSPKNINQHTKVLAEIHQRGYHEWNKYLHWFRQMPLFFEPPGFRVIHACWDQRLVDFVKENQNNIRDEKGRLTHDFLLQASTEGTPMFEVVDILSKGKEIHLPPNHPGIPDKDGHVRKKVRLRWWMTGEEREKMKTYDHIGRSGAMNHDKLSSVPLPPEIINHLRQDDEIYPPDAVPVFIGHYWFTGTPYPLTPNIASVDYSAARGGYMACYQWDGEKQLDKSKFIYV